MIVFPLETQRLRLAPLAASDRDAFVAYRRDPDVARWQSWTPDYDARQADALLHEQPATVSSGSGLWLQIGIHEKSTQILLGDVAVHALAEQPDTYELGVTVAPSAQRTGIATEAVRAVTGELFASQHAHRVVANTDARNTPVARLFARLGFRHEGRAVDADWFKGEWTSIDTWALLQSERGALEH